MIESTENGDNESQLDLREECGHEPKKKKVSRNLSEKKRRDKLNIYISELAAMVPSCATSQRKLDKTTVLKMTVNYMKVHNDLTMSVLGNESGLMSSFLASEELGELLDKALSGFLLVLSKTGDLVFVSKSIENLLGIKKESLIGKSMLEVVHPDDKQMMVREVFGQEEEQSRAFTNQVTDVGDCLDSSPSRHIFNFRMLLRSQSGDPAGWEMVHCVGYSDQWTKKISSRKKQGMVGGDNGESADPLDAALAPFFLVGVGILSRPSFIRLVDSDCEEDEFTSRHSLDGKFLFIDPRSIPITGYLPFEILGTSIYNYIHQEDLSIYSKAHESLMEYGESKTGCYRILIKGYQWMWATSRSYISFNHWNSKPEIYCSTTKMLSAAEGARSLEVRQKEEEIMKANQDNHKSRFSLQKAPASKSNCPQEANAKVLAQWAADEQTFTPLSPSKSDYLVETEFTEGQDAAMENAAKGDVGIFPLAGNKRSMNEAPSAESDSDTREARDTDSDLLDLPSTVEELNSFREAQRLLQDQLVEKHSILMKAVSKQKEQLKEIQQHMILNLQSQLFVDPVKIQETCSSYLERNKVLSERHEEQEQALDNISRKLEEQIQNAEQRYQRHFKAVMEKKALEQKRQTPEQGGVHAPGETMPGTSLPLIHFRGQPREQIDSVNAVTEGDESTSHPQRIFEDVSLQARHTASPLELIPLDSRVDLQKQAHIEEVQGGLSFLKRSSDSPPKPLWRNPKVSRMDANPNQAWAQAMSADTAVDESMADSVQSNTVGFNRTSQSVVQPFSLTNGCTSITATTSVMASPLPSSRMLDPQPSQAVHNHDTLQSPYPSVRTVDESRPLHHQAYPPPQQGSSGMAAQPLHENAAFPMLSGQSADQFAINQLESTLSGMLQQQQQEQQQSQMNAGLAQTIGQLFMNSAQNQQIMQVLLTVLSALQAQPQVAASLMTLIKQMQGNPQQEEVPAQPQAQPVPSSAQFAGASSHGQPTSELLSTTSTPYSYMNNVTYQQQQQQQEPRLGRQRLSHQPQQATRRDRETAGMSANRVSSTTTSYSVALHQQQQQQQAFQQPFSRSTSLANSVGSNSLGFMSYGTMPSTSVGSPATATRDLSSLDKKKHSKSKGDYFSNFSSEELRAMLVEAPGSADSSPVPKQEKKLEDNELLYNPLLTQQQQLLQLHQEQRRQLLLHQQEQRLLMFEEQRKQQQRREAEQQQQQQQQQQHTASPSSSSSFGGGSLHVLLSQDPQEGSSRQPSDTSVQDTGASFSGWSEHSYGLGEADEQVLSLLLAESTYDPVLENLDWGDDSYTGDINLNPD